MKLKDAMPDLVGANAWFNAELTREQLIGDKPTAFLFWSSSCHLCRTEIPKWNVFFDNCKDKLNVVYVHVPRNEYDMNLEVVQNTVTELGITHPVFVDSDSKLSDAFCNAFTPAYYIFDPEGRLYHFQAGGSGMFMFMKRLNRIL